MDDTIRLALGTNGLTSLGLPVGGLINSGQAYMTDNGKIFVKSNQKAESRRMFEGEFASLEAIRRTNTIRVPEPFKIVDLPNSGAIFVMEFLKMQELTSCQTALGEQIARLHRHNGDILAQLRLKENCVHKTDSKMEAVEEFGFHTTTCCGYLPLDNSWQKDWPTFFIRQRLQPQIDMLEKDHHDEEVIDLWKVLIRKIHKFFCCVQIQPALLHGDLHGFNIAELQDESVPVIFDPGCYYGHSESDMALTTMFGGFTEEFYTAYHKLCPKQPGYDQRNSVYQLFNYLNKWNHFGPVDCRQQCKDILTNLVNMEI